jgi:hypothetical protein
MKRSGLSHVLCITMHGFSRVMHHHARLLTCYASPCTVSNVFCITMHGFSRVMLHHARFAECKVFQHTILTPAGPSGHAV